MASELECVNGLPGGYPARPAADHIVADVLPHISVLASGVPLFEDRPGFVGRTSSYRSWSLLGLFSGTHTLALAVSEGVGGVGMAVTGDTIRTVGSAATITVALVGAIWYIARGRIQVMRYQSTLKTK